MVELKTISGHNMYDMASLMQKAIRRGEKNNAIYAALELSYKYRSMMWNRICVIASEDCWGIISKEILKLRKEDEEVKSKESIIKAVSLLCDNKKSRDGCYFSCNFILTDDIVPKINEEIQLNEELDIQIINYKESMMRLSFNIDSEKIYYETLLYKYIDTKEYEILGYATRMMYYKYNEDLWKELMLISDKRTGSILTKEISALKQIDNKVNGKRTKEKKDLIFVAKAIMLFIYYFTGEYQNLLGLENMDYFEELKEIDIQEGPYKLANDEIPEYTFDLHTLKGKERGATDVEMTISEQEALYPKEKDYFGECGWQNYYDMVIRKGQMGDKEKHQYEEFKKDRKLK